MYIMTTTVPQISTANYKRRRISSTFQILMKENRTAACTRLYFVLELIKKAIKLAFGKREKLEFGSFFLFLFILVRKEKRCEKYHISFSFSN